MKGDSTMSIYHKDVFSETDPFAPEAPLSPIVHIEPQDEVVVKGMSEAKKDEFRVEEVKIEEQVDEKKDEVKVEVNEKVKEETKDEPDEAKAEAPKRRRGRPPKNPKPEE